MASGKLETKISALEKSLQNPNLPDAVKKSMKDTLELLKKQQAEKKAKTAVSKAPAKKKAAAKKKVVAATKAVKYAKKRVPSDKLSKMVRLSKKYAIYRKSGVDLKKDAGEPAKPIGKRKSRGLKANQYGSKAQNKGRTYYEYRPNRLDVKQPPKTFPKL
jgi:hypothetical protein